MLRMAQTGLFLRESFPGAEHAQQALPPSVVSVPPAGRFPRPPCLKPPWSPCRPQGGFRALRV